MSTNSISKVDVTNGPHNANSDQTDYFSQLPPALALDVLNYLNPKEILNTGRTSKLWQVLSSDKNLWKDKLKKDFGDTTVRSVLDGNYKKAYEINSIKILNLILSLPEGPAFIETAKQYPNRELWGILTQELFDNFFDSLPEACSTIEDEIIDDWITESLFRASDCGCVPFIEKLLPKLDIGELGELFHLSIKEKKPTLTRIILDSERFCDISLDDLGNGLRHAAKYGMTDLISEIMKRSIFEQIPLEGNFGLMSIYTSALNGGNPKTVQLLIAHPKLREISSKEGLAELGISFCVAAKKGNIQAMKQIMAHPNFQDIPSEGDHGIGQAFVEASAGGHIEAMIMIMQSPETAKKFQEVPANGNFSIGHALSCASKSGKFEAVQLIMKLPQFNDILPNGDWGFERAFYSSIRYGHRYLMLQLMESSKIDQISANGEYGLGHCLWAAAVNQYPDALENMRTLMYHPKFADKFRDISNNGKNGLGYILGGAAKYHFYDGIRLLMENERFNEISPGGRWGLGGAFIKAILTNPTLPTNPMRLKVMKLIAQAPRFNEVPADEEYGIGDALYESIDAQDIDMMQIIMSLPNFLHKIAIDGPYGLRKARNKAIEVRNNSARDLIGCYISSIECSAAMVKNSFEVAPHTQMQHQVPPPPQTVEGEEDDSDLSSNISSEVAPEISSEEDDDDEPTPPSPKRRRIGS